MASEHEPTLVWERPEPPARPTPSPLSRERITAVAVELADADGLDGVSLRKVAAALGAGPMRLYGYLSTKEELLDLMIDAVYREFVLPAPDAPDWREAVRSIARQNREAALRHPWFPELLSGRPQLGPHALAHLEALFNAFAKVPGLTSIDSVMAAAGTMSCYVYGATDHEMAEHRMERATGRTEEDWQLSTGAYIGRMLATGRFPTLERVIVESGPADPAAAFEIGLDIVLAGIEARLGATDRVS